MNHPVSPRDIAYCGLFGAAALLLPILFHLIHLGHIFMPMYLPLMALAFFVQPLPAAVTAFLVPLCSGVMTGMPPFYPPIAVFMALELSCMAGLTAWLRSRWPKGNEWIVLLGVLLLGRGLYIGLVYFFSLWIELPAGWIAGLSFLKGWPGIVLMMIVVPPVARIGKSIRVDSPGKGEPSEDQEKVAFFNSIAKKWDGWENEETLAEQFSAAFGRWAIQPGETVVDIGCGTGNLTRALLRVLSAEGRVVAVDMAPAMINEAQRKNPDDRVQWHIANAARLPISSASCDRIFCYSVWPHFDDPDTVLAEFRRILRPGGWLYIWHLASRETINSIHATASHAVSHDVLKPASETAELLARCGFTIHENEEDDTHYLVTARFGDSCQTI